MTIDRVMEGAKLAALLALIVVVLRIRRDVRRAIVRSNLPPHLR